MEFQGIPQGIALIPCLIYQHRRQRYPIAIPTLQSHQELRRSEPQVIQLKEQSTILCTTPKTC